MGPNMGPPFGRRTAEKRLELKIYMGYTMAHEFGEHIPELLGHRVAHIRAVSQPFLSQHLRFIVPTSKYLFIVAFPNVWKLLVMATLRPTMPEIVRFAEQQPNLQDPVILRR